MTILKVGVPYIGKVNDKMCLILLLQGNPSKISNLCSLQNVFLKVEFYFVKCIQSKVV
jgi:hypothetical protein